MNIFKKASLRKEYLGKRLALLSDDIALKNNDLTKNLQDLLTDKACKVLHTFLPQVGKNEVDTWKIVAALLKLFPDIAIALPYVIPGTRQMQHYAFTPQIVLVENKWGIPEPDPLFASLILPQSVDVVLIPLLAFDKLGYRVGYGGGYYDRFLAECRPDVIKIGLSLFDPVEQIEDVNLYDIAMNYCVTPGKVWRW